jgi:hypothetical protein
MREEALLTAPEIVRHLLEDEDDFDVKEVDDPQSEDGWWEQIDGDFGSAWDYGGYFYNPIKRIIWYFEGMDVMDQLGIHEIQPEDVEVPPQVMANIEHRFPSNYLDPDGDLEWQQRTRDDNEREREQLVSQYQTARAAFLNERKRFPWYEIHVSDDGKLDSWLEQHAEGAAQAMGQTVEEFRSWPLQNQLCELTRYVGVDELGHKFEMSKREAEQALGQRI